MTREKSIQYKKAYVELNEILNHLSNEQRDKISANFINNISSNMDRDYKFTFDESKGILEQNLMVETEALLVEIYERYLAPDEEKELWQKYDRFCLNKIENEKKEKYNVDVFSKKNIIEKQNLVISNKDSLNKKDNNRLPVEYKKGKIFNKIVNFIKGLIGKI